MMTDSTDTTDSEELRVKIEELEAYIQMSDLTFESRVSEAVEERIEAARKDAYSDAFDEGFDAGREQANTEFNKHIQNVRSEIDEALDIHLSDYTA